MTYDVRNPDPGLGQTPKSILIVKCFISNMYIFTLISLNDIVITSELTLTLKIIVQCDIKHIMMLPIKTIMSVLKVST
jgi:hypothetical protein